MVELAYDKLLFSRIPMNYVNKFKIDQFCTMKFDLETNIEKITFS